MEQHEEYENIYLKAKTKVILQDDDSYEDENKNILVKMFDKYEIWSRKEIFEEEGDIHFKSEFYLLRIWETKTYQFRLSISPKEE